MNQALAQQLFQTIDSWPILDPHSHVRPQQPVAHSLADLLGYHYYTELAQSAEFEEGWWSDQAEPVTRVQAILPKLKYLRNTIQYSWMMLISREFLGIPADAWQTQTAEWLVQTAQKAIDAPDYQQTILQKTGLQRIYLTNAFDEPIKSYDTNLFRPCLRVDDLVFTPATSQVATRLHTTTGCDISDLNGLKTAVREVFKRFVQAGMAYPAVSTPANLVFEPVDDVAAESMMRPMLDNLQPDPGVRDRWASWMLQFIAGLCQEYKVPFHLMLGVTRNAYPFGVPSGKDLFPSTNRIDGFDGLFNLFPKVNFPTSVLSDTSGLELTAAAWIRHNIYPSGHWWYSNNPIEIERDVRRRLELVPWNKPVAYYSDAYYLEFVLPKFRMYKFCLAKVLANAINESAQHPNREPLTTDDALAIAHAWLLDNPKRIFQE
ncbi:MAG: glucuronate isomerase [Verrucomicrobiota bacterium]|nr:glucuronate isomerase [Verrucomicrobiota bacterium]